MRVIFVRLFESGEKVHLIELSSSRECHLPRTAQKLHLHVLTLISFSIRVFLTSFSWVSVFVVLLYHTNVCV